MKRKIALLTTILLLLGTVSACGGSSDSAESTNMATVANLFAPTTVPTETESDTQSDSGTESASSTKENLPALDSSMGGGMGIVNEKQQDSIGKYVVYEGGEMHVFLWLCFTGYSEVGIGVQFFVDGQAQAFYTPEDPTYSYMHILYPEDNVEYIMELIFVPVTGEAGDTLEYGFYVIEYPDYFLGDESHGTSQIGGRFNSVTFRVKYQETPPAAEIVPVQDRVLSTSLTYVDLSSSEISSISQDEVEYTFYVDGKADWGYFWNVEEAGTETVTVRFVLQGSSLARFGLVVFYNLEPVSVSPEDLMFVSTNNGQKAILEAEIDLSGFDGEGVLYAILVPRNYKIAQLDSSCSLQAMGEYFFSSTASREELLTQSGVS